MLNGAFYCILRIHLISKASLGPEFSGGLLLTLGLLSVLIATPFILIQWDLKRLLAYSSIEHVGIMAVGVGLGGEMAERFGALLHMTYHSLAKPVAFFSAGTLAQLHSSSDFKRIGNGTFTRAPVASALFVLAALMITGSPPFGLFFSEMTILQRRILRVARRSRRRSSSPRSSCCSAASRFRWGDSCWARRAIPDRRVPQPERFDLGMATAAVAAALAVVSAFYLPSGADVTGARRSGRRVEGRMTPSPTTVSAALETAPGIVITARQGELTIGRGSAGAARPGGSRDLWPRRAADVFVCDR